MASLSIYMYIYIYREREDTEKIIEKSSTNCVNGCILYVFKKQTDTYRRGAGYTYVKNYWSLDNPIASLSTSHMFLLMLWMVIWLNLGNIIVVDVSITITLAIIPSHLPNRSCASSLYASTLSTAS